MSTQPKAKDSLDRFFAAQRKYAPESFNAALDLRDALASLLQETRQISRPRAMILAYHYGADILEGLK